MRFAIAAALALATLAAPAPAGAWTKSDARQQDERARAEIQRILDADNVDTTRLSSRQVANAIRVIPRGRAPADFWRAYQRHVRAWRRYAEVDEEARRLPARGAPAIRMVNVARAVERAQREIAASFEEIERIARLYGAQMPIPPGEPLPPII